MRNFHIKSILLGIGIGIVITSVISMIYAAGIDTSKGLSNEEIIEKAKALGMVDGTALLSIQQDNGGKKSGSTADVKIDSSSDANANKNTEEDTKKKVEKPEEKKVEVSEAIISVKPGDTSERVAQQLLQNNLIKDKKAFVDKLNDMGLESEINVGEFKIGKGTGEIEIIKMITGRK